MDWLDYREKLGIGFDDENKFRFFLNLISNALDTISESMRLQVTYDEYFSFCNTTGSLLDPCSEYGMYDNIYEIFFDHQENLKEFLLYFVAFINCQISESNKKWSAEDLKNLLCKCLESSHILYDLIIDNDGYFIFPKGAEELDDALVSQPLEWLKDYPQARKTYCIALKQYADGIYIRDVADNLRKALEEFLQEFLGNTQNLERNKTEICRYLGQNGIDAGISGLFQPLINSYKNINDRIAKHHDKVDEKLLEFLLYQTGVLIRMVITVTDHLEETENET